VGSTPSLPSAEHVPLRYRGGSCSFSSLIVRKLENRMLESLVALSAGGAVLRMLLDARELTLETIRLHRSKS
jgi:hypothetical protein